MDGARGGGCGGHRRGRRGALRRVQRNRGHGEVRGGRDEHRAGDPQGRDHPEAARVGAENGAERIRGVEDGARSPEAGIVADEAARDDREGCAHRDGRREQHDRRREAAHEHADGRREIAARDPRKARQLLEQRQRAEREPGDRQLEHRVGPQRPTQARNPARREQVAEREPAEEDGEHRADRFGRRAERETQEPRPQHLVDESREAGEGEARDDRDLRVHVPPDFEIGRRVQSRIGRHVQDWQARSARRCSPSSESSAAVLTASDANRHRRRRRTSLAAPRGPRPARSRPGPAPRKPERRSQVARGPCRCMRRQHRAWHAGC